MGKATQQDNRSCLRESLNGEFSKKSPETFFNKNHTFPKVLSARIVFNFVSDMCHKFSDTCDFNLLVSNKVLFDSRRMTQFYCSYPLLNFSPLPGKIPTKVVLPFNVPPHATLTTSYKVALDARGDSDKKSDDEIYDASDTDTDQVQSNLSSFLPVPSPELPWARLEQPFVYVQQIILRSVVLPYSKDLLLTDAFRGPLFEVFKLIEIINNHETNVTLSNFCLHVENVKRSHKDALFPEYNCLVLSPANFWRQNIHDFNKDNSLLGTIYKHHVKI